MAIELEQPIAPALPRDWFEKECLEAVRLCFEDDRYADLAPAVIEALIPVVEKQAQELIQWLREKAALRRQSR